MPAPLAARPPSPHAAFNSSTGEPRFARCDVSPPSVAPVLPDELPPLLPHAATTVTKLARRQSLAMRNLPVAAHAEIPARGPHTMWTDRTRGKTQRTASISDGESLYGICG